MANEPTYEFYRDTFGGSMGEDAFHSVLPEACSRVRFLVGYNEVDDDSREAFMRAVCAVADVLSERGGTGGGFTIGSFSVSGEGSAALKQAMDDAAVGELLGTDLLYAGVC